MVHHVFGPNKTTLAHLACALGSSEIISVLMKRSGNGSNRIWTQKDDEGMGYLYRMGKRERECIRHILYMIVCMYVVYTISREEREKERERERERKE